MLTVRDLMTEYPLTVGPAANLAQAYDLMEGKQVRHLPVVDPDQRLLGLITHRDLVRSALCNGEVELPLGEQREILRGFRVGDLMIRNPETVAPDDELDGAGQTILDNKFGCLPVLQGTRLVGILTEADFVRYTVESLSR